MLMGWVQEEFREGLPGEVVREQHERAQAFVATHTHHFATDRHDLLQAHPSQSIFSFNTTTMYRNLGSNFTWDWHPVSLCALSSNTSHTSKRLFRLCGRNEDC